MRFNSFRKVLALIVTPHSVVRRLTNARQFKGSASIHSLSWLRWASVNLLGAPLRGWSGKLFSPFLHHFRRRSRIASGFTPWCSATATTVWPSDNINMVCARSRSRQSLPFLTIVCSCSRSLSLNSIGFTRIPFLPPPYLKSRYFTACRFIVKHLQILINRQAGFITFSLLHFPVIKASQYGIHITHSFFNSLLNIKTVKKIWIPKLPKI